MVIGRLSPLANGAQPIAWGGGIQQPIVNQEDPKKKTLDVFGKGDADAIKRALARCIEKKEFANAQILLDAGGALEIDALANAVAHLPTSPEEMQSSVTTIKFLLENGGRLDRRGVLSILDEHFPSLKPDIDAALAKHFNPLQIAVLRGSVVEIDAHVANTNALRQMDNYGQTLLMLAVAAGRKEIVEHLIAKGAPVNLQGAEGTTPLMMAASHHKPDLVRSLVAAHAEVDRVDRKKASALMAACAAAAEGVEATKDQRQVLTILSGMMANLNLADADGYTAIMIAARGNQRDAVQTLILLGADLQLKDHKGSTVLMFAAQHSTKACVADLLEGELRINEVDKQGETALFYAVRAGNIEVARLFVERYAKVNILNRDGKSVLQIAKDLKQIDPTRPDFATLLERYGAK